MVYWLMLGIVLLCVVLFILVSISRIYQRPHTTSNVSQDKSPASNRAAAPPLRTDGPDLGKIQRSPQEAFPNTLQPSTNPPIERPNVKGTRGMPMIPDPTAWIRNLSKEKRQQVDRIFSENAECIRQRKDSDTKGKERIDPEQVHQIFEHCNDELKSKMSSVLSTEEEEEQSLRSLKPVEVQGTRSHRIRYSWKYRGDNNNILKEAHL